MNIVAHVEGTVVRLVLSGELDMSTAPDLRDQVGRVLAARPAALLVDLAGVVFCDSSGIGALSAAPSAP